jgi:NAD(P)-dependent dehydrogenase (short-subunit alcohol dehydrogenase family)
MSIFGEIEALNMLIVGVNQGIGLGFVQYLLQNNTDSHGFSQPINRIYATHRHEPSQELAAIAAQQIDRLHLIPMDVTDETQIIQAIAQIQTQIDRLHFVIYCVGLLHNDTIQPEKSLQQINADRLLKYFQVNSIGAVLLAKHLLPLLKHRERSVFASISAKVGSIGDNQLGGWYGYRASKAALNMLMRTVAIEYSRKSPHTIVALLHPGTTDTPLSKPFQRNVAPDKLFSVDRTVTQLMAVIEQLQPDDSGQFFSWDGSRLPW